MGARGCLSRCFGSGRGAREPRADARGYVLPPLRGWATAESRVSSKSLLKKQEITILHCRDLKTTGPFSASRRLCGAGSYFFTASKRCVRHPRRAVINLLINSIQLILYQRWITLTTNTPRSTIPSGARSSTKAHARTPEQRPRTRRPAGIAGLP